MQRDLRRNVQAAKLWRSHFAATATHAGRNPTRARRRWIAFWAVAQSHPTKAQWCRRYIQADTVTGCRQKNLARRKKERVLA
jgi:hypothetical protein